MQNLTKLFFGASLLFLVFSVSHCSLDGTCYEQTEVPLIRFEMPDSVLVNTNVSVNLVYVTYSNCSRLNNLYDNLSGDTISLHVIAEYEGCSCPDVLPDSAVIYSFTPAAVRNYIFRAWKYDGTILQDTLVVYE